MFKIKYNKDSSIQKHKTRIIAKTYSQQLIVDFFETFAPKINDCPYFGCNITFAGFTT